MTKRFRMPVYFKTKNSEGQYEDDKKDYFVVAPTVQEAIIRLTGLLNVHFRWGNTIINNADCGIFEVMGEGRERFVEYREIHDTSSPLIEIKE